MTHRKRECFIFFRVTYAKCILTPWKNANLYLFGLFLVKEWVKKRTVRTGFYIKLVGGAPLFQFHYLTPLNVTHIEGRLLILVLDLMLSYLNGTIFALKSTKFFSFAFFKFFFFPVSSNVFLLSLIFLSGIWLNIVPLIGSHITYSWMPFSLTNTSPLWGACIPFPPVSGPV